MPLQKQNNDSMFNFNFVRLSPFLKQYVTSVWYRCPDIGDCRYSTYKLLADGAPGLIFHQDNGRSAIAQRDGAPLPVAFIYGQATKPCYNLEKGHSFIFGINFKPTALNTLFGIDAHEATDKIISLDDIANYPITEALLNAPDPESLVDTLAAFLWRRHRKHGTEDAMMDRSVALIARAAEGATAGQLAQHFGLSERQFQRKFKQFIGVNLTTYARILRFQRALHLLRHNRHRKLSDLAYQLGFADHSHFTREFKFFADEKPKDILKLNRACANPHTECPRSHFVTNRIVLC